MIEPLNELFKDNEQIVFWYGSLITLMIAIYSAFKFSDEVIDPDKKKIISEDLLGIRARVSGSWLPDFLEVFDNVYGKKHFSLRCFSISAFASILSVFAIYLVNVPSGSRGLELKEMVVLTTFNVIIDYFSLLETRKLLNVKANLIVKLVADGIITFMLAILSFSLLMSVVAGESLSVVFTDVIVAFFSSFGNPASMQSATIRAIIFTSFMTSVFLWLHLLSYPTVKYLSTANVLRWLDVKEKPLISVAVTINFYTFLLGSIIYVLFL